MNRSQIKSTLLNALESAGKILKKGISAKKTIEKKTELSLVTVTDKEAEKKVISVIRKAFPQHALLTEESPPMGNSASRWIIDPLDGTTNFAHTFEVVCTSIAYEENGEILHAGVYNPFSEELFTGEKGHGAFLNGRKIRVSANKTLRDSLLCTGFPYDRREHPDEYLAVFKAFMMKVQDIRRTGAAALDLCHVACGRFDGYWELNLQPWDKAAGMLIVKEAGGRVTDFCGKKLSIADKQNVASNGFIHAEMLRTLKPFQRVGEW